MLRNRWIGVLLAGVLIAGTATAAAFTYPWDKHTKFTFSGPVAVPGVTLPAGSYIFRVADTSGRHVIQVLSTDRQASYALFFGLSASRSDIPTEPELRFMETGYGVPLAIESLWYPGLQFGYEFVYPKEQADRLRRGMGRPVLTTVEETATPAETGGAEWAEGPFEGEYAFEPGPALRGDILPLEEEFEQAPEPALPKTAGPMPLAGMGGLALLLGAAILRGWRMTR